ncbi:FmdB family zinc ribbon protein [Staphylococcus sp. 11261D007BR]
MPNYTYECEQCGPFTLRQRMSEQHETTPCPSCERDAKRVFVAFQTYQLDSRVKKRIEKGQTPRVVKRENLPKQQKPSRPSATRPWMVDH